MALYCEGGNAMVVYENAILGWEEDNTSLCEGDCIENSCGCDSEGGGCDTADWGDCTNDV